MLARDLESDYWAFSEKPYPEDFDKDISELESESSCTCHCASDASKCECDLDKEDSVDAGSEAGCYQDYKEMREERKQELARLRKDQERTIEYHKAREDEVKKEWTEFNQNKNRGVKGCELRPSRSYIEFYWPDQLGDRTNWQVVGHIYFDANITSGLKAFQLPKRARRSSINIGVIGSDKGITVKFINQYLLKMTVPRSIACPHTQPANTPELLEFVGISRLFENERTRQENREQKEAEARRREQREVSPKESRFDMNHPMGPWAQSSWW